MAQVRPVKPLGAVLRSVTFSRKVVGSPVEGSGAEVCLREVIPPADWRADRRRLGLGLQSLVGAVP